MARKSKQLLSLWRVRSTLEALKRRAPVYFGPSDVKDFFIAIYLRLSFRRGEVLPHEAPGNGCIRSIG